MSVLSDREIRNLIREAQMIQGGTDERIFACSYEFRPGIIVSTGPDSDRSTKDWTGPTVANDLHAIQPGELVWVRTLEKVAMPKDICAFWWQTNRLSRQGLMLVNMSMIEPGYRGPLACLFVNFGAKPVIIEPDTVVAKLVFERMGTDAQKPLDLKVDYLSYDRALISAAMDTPVTFLDVGNIEPRLDLKRNDAIAELQSTLDRFKRELRDEAETVRRDTQRDFESDSKSLIRRVLGAAALGFVLVIAAMTFVPWLQSTIRPSLSTQIQQQVDDTLTQRLLGTGSIGTAQEVTQLQQEVQKLEQQVRASSTSAGKLSRRGRNPVRESN
jgi:deoxycytidine triphosphate deaminase